ncbi:MAG TPA: amidohydrolase family protein [Bryobacteraceae bacterium]|nr:amidohydrolase family protein [Bryobacteraceae bacterium]
MPQIAAIDAHHHLWKYNPQEYPWIAGGMGALQRDFLPNHFKKEMDLAGVSVSVAVQARQTLEETNWLLSMAEDNDFIRGVVGWVPLTAPDLMEQLEPLMSRGKLKGVRHVLQDEADDRYLLRQDFQSGIRRLRTFGLSYDILIYERHLPQTIQFVDTHPNQLFILDHVGKPRIKDGRISPWRENLRELARRENVYCKVSGMAVEADWARWTPDELKPYFDVALEAFSARRLMFGSDWPVLQVAGSYLSWNQMVRRWVSGLSRDEELRILRGTALEAYNL